MIQNFLRRPLGAAEFVADALRVIGLASVVVAAVFFQATDAGVLAFVLPGLLLPRFVGARPAFDIMFSVLLLVAGWSNVLDLYTSVRWWDIPVHIACTGAIAAMVYLLLAQVGVLAHPVPRHAMVSSAGAAGHPSSDGARFTVATGIVLTTAFGLAVSALWEMVEWFGHAFISSAIFVEYNDTIGDMAVGALGALAAGVVLSLVPLERRPAGGASRLVDRAGPASGAATSPGAAGSTAAPANTAAPASTAGPASTEASAGTGTATSTAGLASPAAPASTADQAAGGSQSSIGSPSGSRMRANRP